MQVDSHKGEREELGELCVMALPARGGNLGKCDV